MVYSELKGNEFHLTTDHLLLFCDFLKQHFLQLVLLIFNNKVRFEWSKVIVYFPFPPFSVLYVNRFFAYFPYFPPPVLPFFFFLLVYVYFRYKVFIHFWCYFVCRYVLIWRHISIIVIPFSLTNHEIKRNHCMSPTEILSYYLYSTCQYHWFLNLLQTMQFMIVRKFVIKLVLLALYRYK